MLRVLLVLFFIVQLLLSCATLPDYAKPQLGVQEDIGQWQELISYRDLSIADFKASSLSGELGKHSYKLQAHTKLVVRATEDVEFSIYATQAFNKIQYRGGIETLSFEALMVPEASWWSTTIPSEKRDYVLQHEQIHFAIMELAARRMNEEVREDSSRFICYGKTREEVEELLVDKISAYITKKLTVALAEHTRFDKETSLKYDPRVQLQWYEGITEELKL